MAMPDVPPKPRKRRRLILVLLFTAVAVLGVFVLAVWLNRNALFNTRSDTAEARRLAEVARTRPLTDDEFDSAFDLLDSISPAAQISAVTVLESEAVRT